MQIQQYPKKDYKRRVTKAKRNKKPTVNDICEVCGKSFAAQHEIFFGGKHRRLSQIYGLTKRLCYEHHNMPGGKNPHHNKAIDNAYKQEGQRKFEAIYGHSRWMEEFGRDYIG
jgi:hypothetical protein